MPSANAGGASTLIPIDPMIGEDFTFSVTFDNPGTIDRNSDGVPDTVYGPYIDMVFDGGLDAGIGSGAEISNDGITFVNANYLGSTVQSHVQTVGATGSVTHHWATDTSGAPLVVSGLTPGDQFVTLLMPFGSFTPGQTPAEVVVNAHMSINADVNVPLDVDIITGAMFGTDSLNNPGTDNPLRSIDQRTLHFLPEVIAFNTDIRVANVRSDCQEQHGTPDDTRSTESNHQEIPTGPNFPGVYVSTIDIAAGQTVGGPTTGIIYTQHIPNTVLYTGVLSVEVNGTATTAFTIVQEPTGANGGDLVLRLNNPVTGTSDADDIIIEYGFYVPETSGAGGNVLNPVTGDDGHLINDGEVTYRWTPIDSTHDAPVTATIDAEVDADGNFSDNPNVDDISHLQSIAIQKSHTFATDTGTAAAGTLGAYNPGDILAYTLDFQLSDYFSFGDGSADSVANFTIVDTIANGLVPVDGSFDPDFAFTLNPTITIYEEGSLRGSLPLDLSTQGRLWWTTPGTTSTVDSNGNPIEVPDGSVNVHYDLQAILIELGDDGILNGGYSSGSPSGATYGTITYQSTIQQYYANGYQLPVGAEHNIDQGDILAGGVTITGDIFDRGTGLFTGASEADQSCDSLAVVTGGVEKEIYAINTVIGNFSTPSIQPGDTISYRLTYDLPISSTEDFHMVDYLPLPVFDVMDPDQDGTPSGWTQVQNINNPLSALEIGRIPSALVAGSWFFGPDHTYTGTSLPTTSRDAGNNSLSLDWLFECGKSDIDEIRNILFYVSPDACGH